MNRREILLTIGSASVMATAGCTDTTESNNESSEGNGEGSVESEESFVMEMHTGGTTQGEALYVMRVNGRNSHTTYRGQEELEIFFVDGDVYQVSDGQCFTNPGQTQTPSMGPSPEPGEDWDPAADLPGEHDRRETIDGQEMLVYEYEPGADTVYQGVPVTAYVSAETGYLRRIESDMWRVDYHSWGEVDPIEPPDMECEEVGSGYGDE